MRKITVGFFNSDPWGMDYLRNSNLNKNQFFQRKIYLVPTTRPFLPYNCAIRCPGNLEITYISNKIRTTCLNTFYLIQITSSEGTHDSGLKTCLNCTLSVRLSCIRSYVRKLRNTAVANNTCDTVLKKINK